MVHTATGHDHEALEEERMKSKYKKEVAMQKLSKGMVSVMDRRSLSVELELVYMS